MIGCPACPRLTGREQAQSPFPPTWHDHSDPPDAYGTPGSDTREREGYEDDPSEA